MSDVEFVKTTTRIRKQIEELRLTLSDTRDGCACGHAGLCAFHAVVWNELIMAETHLFTAGKTLLRRER